MKERETVCACPPRSQFLDTPRFEEICLNWGLDMVEGRGESGPLRVANGRGDSSTRILDG